MGATVMVASHGLLCCAGMAGAGPKKRLEENKQRLRLLQALVAAGLATQLARLWLRGVSLWGVVGLAGTVATSGACFYGISALATPVYDQQGSLVDGGADLNRVMQIATVPSCASDSL